MYLLKRKYINYINKNIEKFEKAEDITIIDYGVKCFYHYKDILTLVNGIYLNLIKTDLNKELLKEIENIVEILNNLQYFWIDLNKLENEKEFVESYIELFYTFKYKKLSEFNITENIKVLKPKYISKEEIALIENNTTNNVEEIKNKYLDYYIGDLEEEHYPIISCQEEVKVISLIKNNHIKTVIKEMIDIFSLIYNINKDCFILDNYIYFQITKLGFHKEVIYIIDKLLQVLSYLFNSTSFHENEYYIFDKMEIKNKMYFDLEEELEFAKEVIKQQINSTLSI